MFGKIVLFMLCAVALLALLCLFVATVRAYYLP